MSKNKKNTTGFSWKKFIQKGAIRLSYRAIEMVILFVVGAAFGLRFSH